ncbi:MAG: DUF924 domain-containing protein [Microcoleus sp. PH2017_01_SCD_O_A]|uniref:DUF924 family protein n=1 Tax=Microcoleus sp. PH2017_01_SCD_O_A TaxID=2798812 RepID=UPI001DB4BE02|nr:DUF924 family protein [Microcoleus sp. PH2017_01_SCD_O_A]MCC3428302.1 DUF924 domain-containing protein [Microcoleus sp. PH2017_01_SCD_O_A]MCC3513321.1 DUF924 domain-containing protein [Microcoleus sp. PH2017_17_BER_D_A]
MNEVLDFWFGRSNSPEFGKVQKKWFEKDADFDTEVRSLFLAEYELAASGKLYSWQDSPENCLALIILLDQFPRNMFRENPQAFATDSKALAAAQHAVNNNFDRELLTVQKWFIYLPFEHSENLEHQEKSVELFRQLSGEPDSNSVIDFAVRHFKIIERFGRFPHRNQILGRDTTPAEAEFLKQPGSGF